MMSEAGKALNIAELTKEVDNQARKIYENYKTPFEWKYDEGIWDLEFENVSKRLHYAGVRAFMGLGKVE